ncbi:hypothetical protein PHYSODRAFT_335268 [Phytophthora sojae]|uniref:Uncharacterized protein n=1 Tax=Phytophthora sojae (strain P6497) TaxID=1094619 RepID=G4ZUN7_PHYSP|nr:hypothetical protein PHYSODRAFT_335268 [Phytophthora sojae]EGZ13511.1 hypothetical protein PHYSODRAFT_335268 [Phytophthora sojae]|eukprot:XP_009530940.1 hypothetical protein PHYSODRAFT_335268 [Phytophthora sojae]
MPEIGPHYFVSVTLAVPATVLSILSTITALKSPMADAIPTSLRNPSLESLLLAIGLINVLFILVMLFVSLNFVGNRRLQESYCGCVFMIVFGVCFLVLLLVVNVQALRYEGQIASYPDAFRDKFNEIICDLRISEVCAAGDNFDKVLVAVSSTANPTSRVQASTHARDYCSLEFLHGLDSLEFDWDVLDSFIVTPVVDKWCGSYALGLPTNTPSPSSPVSMNPAKYQWMLTKPLKRVRTMKKAGGEFRPVKDELTQELAA